MNVVTVIVRLSILAFVFWTANPVGAQITQATMPPGPSGENPSFITSAVQIGLDRHVFSSEDPGGYKVFYNINQDITLDGVPDPGIWTYNQSLPVINMGSGSLAVGTVLWNAAGGLYKNPQNSALYKGLMYFVYQPSADNGVVAGRLCLSFSNDLLSWTTPISAVYSHTGSTYSNCSLGTGEVQVEAVSAFKTAPSSIKLVFPEGNIPTYRNAISLGTFESQTFTYLAGATAGTPHLVVRSAQLTTNGVYTPNLATELDDHAFLNLSATYEPSSGLFLVNRAYRYPVDVEGTSIPCNNPRGQCGVELGTFPNRGQAYCMRTGTTLSKALTTHNNSWVLEGDLGGPDGWSSTNGGSCAPTALQNSTLQENVGIDINSADFVKNPDGTLWRGPNSQVFVILSGFYDREAVCAGSSTEKAKLFEIRLNFEDCAAAPSV